jgi:type VI secretion system protein VasG
MPTLAPKALVEKINPFCRKALENALGLCVTNTHASVEIEHWLLKLLEPTDGDLFYLLRQFDINPTRVTKELTQALTQLRRGQERSPVLSQDLLDLTSEAWMLASLGFGRSRISSRFLLAALLTHRSLLQRIQPSSPELARHAPKIAALFNVGDAESLRRARMEVQAICGRSVEEEEEPAAGSAESGAPLASSATSALGQFTVDLTERARKGQIDPVLGRDAEIAQVIDILTRRRQNNPILTGEAGVGKTAVVEGLALQIVRGDVPPPLRNVVLRTLDLGLLQAGAGVKGEFENRLKGVLQEVKAAPQPVILFIDEAHTLIGAGGAAGQGDAANMLKPALARGELRTIAATTWSEYKKYFETDSALKRRFQVVKIDEPDVPRAVRMLRGLADMLGAHHQVRVLDQAVTEAVKLSHRYITDRQLPDKCVSLLDTACARVALSRSAIPAPVLAARREIEALDAELRTLERESVLGAAHQQRVNELREQRAGVERRRTELETRWEKEKELAGKVLELQDRLVAATGKTGAMTAEAEGDVRGQLARLEQELAALQGEEPLVLPLVDGQAVAEVVSGWTGIPIGKMVRDEIRTVLNLQARLEERVIGQSHALRAITDRIRAARANLTDPRRPTGVFLLVGPSGVGKTETAIALADILFGGDRNMVIINMSEYKEDHKISRLTGSAPGYVGFGEGGVLTEAVRRKPYSIVLLDEIEKAAVAVQEIFYQVFDKGMLQDDKGNEVNFKNTIILLTSNVGTDTFMRLCADPDTKPEPEALAAALRPDLLKAFKPALLGRLTVVPYYPLSDEMLRTIIQLQLGRIASRVRENHRAEFGYDEGLIATIAGRCKDVESGARNDDHILTGTLLPELAGVILSRLAEGRGVQRAHVRVTPEGTFAYDVD